ncbi:MAG: oxidoreductase [SAR116 cluster bacterium]|nr:oxidoreductase [SAR116 cluster bacterium]
MKLASYWWSSLNEGESIESPDAALPEEADCVVVGSGFAGLMAALTLRRHGRSVVVIDRTQPGLGAATRNGGICSGNIRIPHGELTEKGGRDYADQVYGEGVEARQDLARFIEEEQIDCAYHQPGWFQGAMSPADFDRMSREAERLQTVSEYQAKGHEIRIVGRDDQAGVINTTRFHGGILREGTGAFHPGRFFARLLKLVRGEGVVICPQTIVRLIEDEGSRKRILTDRGSVLAGRVLVTTNAYTGRDQGFSRYLRRRLVPVQSAIIVTEDIGEDRVRSLFPQLSSFSTSANLSAYCRPTPDGRRVLLGSRSFDRLEPSRRTVDFLKSTLHGIFPDLGGAVIDYGWLGNVAFTQNHLPTIFEHDKVIYVGGYAGSGTVWARWLGRKAAEKVLATSNRPSVFDGAPPPEIPLYDGNPWFMPFFNGYFAIRDAINERRFRP